MNINYLPICGLALLSAVSGCGEDGICEELQGTYHEMNTVISGNCADYGLPVGFTAESVSVIGGSGGGGDDPTTECFESRGPGYDLDMCSLDGSVTCDHYDDQGFYLFTRKLTTHFDLSPSGDYVGTADVVISDFEYGQLCRMVMDIVGEKL